MKRIGFVLAALVLLASPVLAGPVNVLGNSSFEITHYSGYAWETDWSGGKFAPWTKDTPNTGVETVGSNAPDGTQIVWFEMNEGIAGKVVEQTTSHNITAADTFQVKFMGSRLWENNTCNMLFSLAYSGGTFMTGSADVLYLSNPGTGDWGWGEYTINFTGTIPSGAVGNPLIMKMRPTSGTGWSLIDNVRLFVDEGGGPAPVAEPSALALVGLGVLGMARRRR